jgi:hypothetical protein
MATYGTHMKKERAWKGEGSDLYKYAVMDATTIYLKPGASVLTFAKSLKEAMETAGDFLLEGLDRIEIGLPSGDIIEIDARYCSMEEEEEA